MGHPNLSPELQRALDNEEPGFFVKTKERGSMLDLVTENHTYRVVVADPEKGELVLFGNNAGLLKPRLFQLQGSTYGGSVTKMGWLGLGMYPRLHALDGGLVSMSSVQSINFIEDAEESERLLAEAEKNRPRTATEEETAQMREKFWEWVDDHDWGEHKDWVHEFVGRFRFLNGQAYISGILVVALEAGKLEDAIRILERQFEEHWFFRPPEFRGELVTEKDAYYLEKAYQDLGLTPPGRS